MVGVVAVNATSTDVLIGRLIKEIDPTGGVTYRSIFALADGLDPTVMHTVQVVPNLNHGKVGWFGAGLPP